MKTLGVIPARWASTRFPGKILAPLAGKPIIQHVWEQAKKSKLLNDVVIACDEDHVLKVLQSFGAKAVMTDKNHPSGSDRIREVLKNHDADIVVNIQGDEPFIDPQTIDQLVKALMDDATSSMTTVIKVLKEESDLNNPNVVKVVIDCKKYAMYFSRAAIPFNRDQKKFSDLKYYKHLGIYAYRRDFLIDYNILPESSLEETERLEQLRVLEAGYRIKTIETTKETVGVDTPEDLKRAEQFLAAAGQR